MSAIKNKLLLIILPWCLILLYNFLKLDTKGGFLENNEALLKILLLLTSLCGNSLLLVSILTRRKLERLNVPLLILLFFVEIITVLSIWFIWGARHGFGF